MSSDKEKDLFTFIDHVGRIVVGQLVEQTDEVVKIQNPVVLDFRLQQGGTVGIQMLPFIIFEVLENRDSNTWTFQRDKIVTSDIRFRDDLVRNYHHINNPPQIIQPAGPVASNTPDVIKLFDD